MEEAGLLGLDDYKEYIPKLVSLKNIRRFFFAVIFLLAKLFSEVFPFEGVCIDTIDLKKFYHEHSLKYNLIKNNF